MATTAHALKLLWAIDAHAKSKYFNSILVEQTGMSDKIMCLRSVPRFVFLILLLLNVVGMLFTKSISYASLMGSPETSTNSLTPLRSDVNGDGFVNMLDIALVGKACFTYPQDPRWNPKLDVNTDGRVNVLDMVLVVKDFGRSIDRSIRKHLVGYGLNAPVDEERIRWMAQFDLVDIDSESAPDVARIKALNPNVIVIAYRSIMSMHTFYDDWAEVDTHEDWFLHDIYGNRIRAVAGFRGWYGMDVSNTEWREHFANYVKNMLETYPDLDGIFIDNAWDSFYDVWNVPKEQLPADIGPRWHNDMLAMIRVVKKTIGDKLLIVNTENNDDYVDACDGKMEEEFGHPSWYTIDEFYGGRYDWESKVESLRNISNIGKYYLAHSGTIIPENSTEADLDKVHNIMLYCFASYLLGYYGDKASFGWTNVYDPSAGYYTEFDDAKQIGSPISEYYSIGSVYARNFTNGRVLVNPTSSVYTIDMPGKYKTLDGQTVSEIIIMQAHTGALLVNWNE